MIRLSYRNAPHGESSPIKKAPENLVDSMSATETGGRGYNLTEMTTDFDTTDPLIYEENLPPAHKSKKHIVNDDVIEMLTLLGDDMDRGDEEVLANFADFLILKFAQTPIEPEDKYRNLIVKISNADLTSTNEIIKKLTKIYNRTIKIEYARLNDLNKAKESAYRKIVHRANQYLFKD